MLPLSDKVYVCRREQLAQGTLPGMCREALGLEMKNLKRKVGVYRHMPLRQQQGVSSTPRPWAVTRTAPT